MLVVKTSATSYGLFSEQTGTAYAVSVEKQWEEFGKEEEKTYTVVKIQRQKNFEKDDGVISEFWVEVPNEEEGIKRMNMIVKDIINSSIPSEVIM